VVIGSTLEFLQNGDWAKLSNERSASLDEKLVFASLAVLFSDCDLDEVVHVEHRHLNWRHFDCRRQVPWHGHSEWQDVSASVQLFASLEVVKA